MRGLVLPDVEEDFAADPVELFFDLAYVFAIAQLVKIVLGDPTWAGVGEAGLLFLMLWLPWTQFTWSANAASSGTRVVRVIFLFATVASVPMAASVSTAFGAGGRSFAIPLAVIFLLGIYLLVEGAGDDRAVRRSSIRYGTPNIIAMAIIVAGSFLDRELRVVAWIAALVIFFVSTLRAGGDEWIMRTGHFAERHGLIVIIALGEVIVALGNSVVVPLTESGSVDRTILLALVLAGSLAGMLWWSYFDRVQPAIEHHAEELAGPDRARFARDLYTYGHIPIVAGVILVAAALEEVTLHPNDPLPMAFRVIAACGFVLFLGGIGADVYRSFHVVAHERLAAAAVIVALLAILGGTVDGVVMLVAIDVVLLAALVIEQRRIERPPEPAAA
jgi:low temperature requirement protein LtrA